MRFFIRTNISCLLPVFFIFQFSVGNSSNVIQSLCEVIVQTDRKHKHCASRTTEESSPHVLCLPVCRHCYIILTKRESKFFVRIDDGKKIRRVQIPKNARSAAVSVQDLIDEFQKEATERIHDSWCPDCNQKYLGVRFT